MRKRLFAFMLVGLFFLTLAGCASFEYPKAVKAMSSGDYSTAYEILIKNPDFKDSKNLIDECKYHLGSIAYENSEWDNAINYLTDITYKDSAELLNNCIREKGMHDKADYSFLADLEESVTRRLEITTKESSDLLTIVNTELAYVEKYHDETFYNDELSQLANRYIDGLNLQKSALSEECKEDQQREWQRGLVDRYEVLNTLYDEFAFCSENKDFVGAYVAQLDSQKTLLNAYDEIWKLLDNQIWGDSPTYKWTKNSIIFDIKNTTKYSFDVTFYYYFSEVINITNESYDYGKQFYDSVTSVNGITPGEVFQVEYYFGTSNVPKYYTMSRCDWELSNINIG